MGTLSQNIRLSKITTELRQQKREVLSLASLSWCGPSDRDMEKGYRLTHHHTSLGADGFYNEVRNYNHHTDD